MIPVVVGTNPSRHEWMQDCVRSIRETSRYRRVLIHRSGGFEVAALRTGIQNFPRFLLLHDSVTILSPDFWNVIDSTDGPAWLTGGPPMHLGIHDSAQLRPILETYPAEIDKRASIFTEGDLPSRVNYATIWPEINDATALRMEHRHGRDNLVLGNDLFEKHKGNWGQTPTM